MNAIEIRNLSKSFRGMYAVDHLNMTVPQGAIYGFIGENGSGKSTTEKLICGHLVPDSGEIKLFGRDYTDPGVRVRVGALIENAGCFPGSSVYQNLMMQCINLGIEDADEQMHYYGLPETQDFYMMFVREDILAELDIEIPKTWDDILAAIPILQANNMQIGMHQDYKIFLYQMGGTLFADGIEVGYQHFYTFCAGFSDFVHSLVVGFNVVGGEGLQVVGDDGAHATTATVLSEGRERHHGSNCQR